MLPAIKVVLDTQVLPRGALARTQSLTVRLYEAWRADQFVLLVSELILAEVDAVTALPARPAPCRFGSGGVPCTSDPMSRSG